MRHSLFFVIFAASLALSGPGYNAEPLRLSIGQAYNAKQPCMSAVTEHLKRLNIDEQDVANISVFPIKPPKGRTLGYRAWISLKSYRGSLVINTTPHCNVMDVYTRGEVRIEGVKHY